MCWLDKSSVETILQVRDQFQISTFVETGTFKGVNAKFHAQNFKEVLTCDISDEYLAAAQERVKEYKNVKVFKQSSPDFLRSFVKSYHKEKRKDVVFMFLDAHFYDPSLPPDEKWVVVNELKALEGFKSCVICIHDFDCEGLGHCCYDGQPLGWPLVKEHIVKVNPHYFFYTNAREFCSIYNEKTIATVPGITLDEDTLSNIRYAHSSDEKTCRGILYCTPQELNLEQFKLKQLEV
ncbi:hypothetical protein ACFL1E_07840, partial [Candidatus Omnitrophota bacterium]